MEPIVATYYLKDKDDGMIHSKIEATNIIGHLDGKCYSAKSWCSNAIDVFDWYFVGDVYCKFDGCTHWYFNGEDYDPELNAENDSYYQICGPECYTEHIRNMCFIWKVAEMVISDSHEGNLIPDAMYREMIQENYEMNGFTGKLVDMMLEGFTITKD